MKEMFSPDLEKEYELEPVGSWPMSRHRFDEESMWAVRAAMAAGRPLLVRGEPGIGKSQLARAVAHYYGVPFLSHVINGRSECSDLLYTFDAVSRLAAAQMAARDETIAARMGEEYYVRPGPLWWAFNWADACAQAQRYCRNGCENKADCCDSCGEPERPAEWIPQMGCVVLIDEIDKADAELPNGLLESLGNTGFRVQESRSSVAQCGETPPPLVVITTNEERELPGAFLRRCFVLEIRLPEEKEAFKRQIIQRGKVHVKSLKDGKEGLYEEAAELLWKDRLEAHKVGLPKPGMAEYIDLLRTVERLSGSEEEQMADLKQVATFAYRKHPDERYLAI